MAIQALCTIMECGSHSLTKIKGCVRMQGVCAELPMSAWRSRCQHGMPTARWAKEESFAPLQTGLSSYCSTAYSNDQICFPILICQRVHVQWGESFTLYIGTIRIIWWQRQDRQNNYDEISKKDYKLDERPECYRYYCDEDDPMH